MDNGHGYQMDDYGLWTWIPNGRSWFVDMDTKWTIMVCKHDTSKRNHTKVYFQPDRVTCVESSHHCRDQGRIPGGGGATGPCPPKTIKGGAKLCFGPPKNGFVNVKGTDSLMFSIFFSGQENILPTSFISLHSAA